MQVKNNGRAIFHAFQSGKITFFFVNMQVFCKGTKTTQTPKPHKHGNKRIGSSTH